jgi:DNA excision repair protein ERCC-5
MATIFLRLGFPNKAVYEAYMNPAIDSSTDPFRWGTPDLDAIRMYTKSKFGWEQSKCDGLILPVIKNLRCEAEQSKQLTLDRFLSTGFRNMESNLRHKTGSKRLNSALKKLKKSAPASGELQLSSESSSDNDDFIKPSATRKPPPKKVRSETGPVRHHESQTKQSPSTSNASRSSSVPAIPKETKVPQKVQQETQRKMNKQRAIEILKNKKP